MQCVAGCARRLFAHKLQSWKDTTTHPPLPLFFWFPERRAISFDSCHVCVMTHCTWVSWLFNWACHDWIHVCAMTHTLFMCVPWRILCVCHDAFRGSVGILFQSVSIGFNLFHSVCICFCGIHVPWLISCVCHDAFHMCAMTHFIWVLGSYVWMSHVSCMNK